MSAALRREIAKLKQAIGAASAALPQIEDPVAWAEQISGLDLDGWQKGVLRSTAKRLMLLCSRQSGKSEAVALLAAVIAVRGGAVIAVSALPARMMIWNKLLRRPATPSLRR